LSTYKTIPCDIGSPRSDLGQAQGCNGGNECRYALYTMDSCIETYVGMLHKKIQIKPIA